MITVRASTVESFRLYCDPDNDMISTEDMERRLVRGEDDDDEPSRPAASGTAWHTAIAYHDDHGGMFRLSDVEQGRAGLAGWQSEVEGHVVLDVDGTPVRVTGHADWLRGIEMLEHKSSLKPIATDKHAESMQWRCYSLIFGIERITYRQAQLAEADSDTFRLVKIEDVVMYAYPQLRDYVVACLRSLLAFAAARGCTAAMDPDSRHNAKREPAETAVAF